MFFNKDRSVTKWIAKNAVRHSQFRLKFVSNIQSKVIHWNFPDECAKIQMLGSMKSLRVFRLCIYFLSSFFGIIQIFQAKKRNINFSLKLKFQQKKSLLSFLSQSE